MGEEELLRLCSQISSATDLQSDELQMINSMLDRDITHSAHA